MLVVMVFSSRKILTSAWLDLGPVRHLGQGAAQSEGRRTGAGLVLLVEDALVTVLLGQTR